LTAAWRRPAAVALAVVGLLGACSSGGGAGVTPPAPDGGEDCRTGTPCAPGFTCDAATGACVKERCQPGGCPAGQQCNVTSGDCEDLPPQCLGVVCEATETCDPETGRCKPNLALSCGGLVCGEGEACDRADNTCRPERCVGVVCPPGQACDAATGACAGARLCTAPGLCPDGEACDAQRGQCVTGDCGVDADCAPGSYCDQRVNLCKFDRCGGVRCAAGTLCDPRTGECVTPPADPCATTTCAAGFACNDVTGRCGALACNLLRQRCGPGLKCDLGPDGPRCVDDAGVGVQGDPCTLTATGSDCGTGMLCGRRFGEIVPSCHRICDALEGGGCRPEEVCTVLDEIDPIGTCESPLLCDVLTPRCPRYLACYLAPADDELVGACFRRGGVGAGRECAGPLVCVPGHSCVGLSREGPACCLPLCRVEGTPGCRGGQECFPYGGAPDDVGVCVAPDAPTDVCPATAP
jgi:hypothetical protein